MFSIKDILRLEVAPALGCTEPEAGTAVQSALFALHGIDVKETDGIIARTAEETMKNMGEISVEGMMETDHTILRIMIEKKLDRSCLNCEKFK